MPPFPRELGYIWRSYLRLRRRTAAGLSGREPVGWLAIDAFIRRGGVSLAPWEVSLIERLDDIYLRPDLKPAQPDGQAVRSAAAASDAQGVKAVVGAIGQRRVVTRRGR